MRIGIICPSEIAFRRFMPAVMSVEGVTYAGVAVASAEEWGIGYNKEIQTAELQKAEKFSQQYGGRIYQSYTELICSDDIDAVYLPLPPALHYEWAMKAISNGKHILLEKPSTTSLCHTQSIIELAREKGIVVHENYMFAFHNQLEDINRIISSGELGDVRLYRISFGFPRREANDFRYNKKLGGGALIDAGGYTVKYATMLLGETAKIRYAQMNYIDEFDVDIYGSASLTNDEGLTAQIAYGMDNNYKCELEVWCSKGCLYTNRILTAPVGFVPVAVIRKGNEDKNIELSEDDSFKKSIEHFVDCINNDKVKEVNYSLILKQAQLIDEFVRIADNNKRG